MFPGIEENTWTPNRIKEYKESEDPAHAETESRKRRKTASATTITAPPAPVTVAEVAASTMTTTIEDATIAENTGSDAKLESDAVENKKEETEEGTPQNGVSNGKTIGTGIEDVKPSVDTMTGSSNGQEAAETEKKAAVAVGTADTTMRDVDADVEVDKEEAEDDEGDEDEEVEEVDAVEEEGHAGDGHDETMEEKIYYEDDDDEEGAVWCLKEGKVQNWSCFFALL